MKSFLKGYEYFYLGDMNKRLTEPFISIGSLP